MTPRSSSQFSGGSSSWLGGPVHHEKQGPAALDRWFLRQDPKQRLLTEVSLRSPRGALFQNTHVRSPTTTPATAESPWKGQDQESIRTATNNKKNLPRESPGRLRLKMMIGKWGFSTLSPSPSSIRVAECLLRTDPPGGQERRGRKAWRSLLRPPWLRATVPNNRRQSREETETRTHALALTPVRGRPGIPTARKD